MYYNKVTRLQIAGLSKQPAKHDSFSAEVELLTSKTIIHALFNIYIQFIMLYLSMTCCSAAEMCTSEYQC